FRGHQFPGLCLNRQDGQTDQERQNHAGNDTKHSPIPAMGDAVHRAPPPFGRPEHDSLTSPVFRNSLLQELWQCNLNGPASRDTDEACPPTRYLRLSPGLQNFVFDTVRAEDRAKGVAVWNTVKRDGMVCGFDAWRVACDGRPFSDHPTCLGASPALQPRRVFFISGLLRLRVSLSLASLKVPRRSLEAISHRRLFPELPPVKPLIGIFCRRATRQET